MPYGDQALFTRKELFDDLGRFPDVPFMEDYDFVKLARARGKIKIVNDYVVSSARRWLAQGIVWTSLLNQISFESY